jgi:hypothetical protein
MATKEREPLSRLPSLSISRERSPIALLADRSSIEPDERDIRVDDYLNDKLQTIADFEDLDALLANVETQRIQLEDQVSHFYLVGCCYTQSFPRPPLQRSC